MGRYFFDGKTERLAAVIGSRLFLPDIPRILVVGCGSGREAAVLQAVLGGEVTGIDPENVFDPALRILPGVRLVTGDATSLSFPDGSFDLVYSFHALEHIPAWEKALLEMRRVLVPGGGVVIGTPNRSRLIGYLGSKSGSSLKEKLVWNMVDWKAKLTGKFRNEAGAHAGFTRSELSRALGKLFFEIRDISNDYYLAVYRRVRFLIRFLSGSGLRRIVFPSIYVMGRKRRV
ncbi:MAG TPA: class I SAM-dependent methyltransferase [Spirochaetia bacterium]|nr:class I SAM-dependent methyltransferase [Spirochaetia bacterium]